MSCIHFILIEIIQIIVCGVIWKIWMHCCVASSESTNFPRISEASNDALKSYFIYWIRFSDAKFQIALLDILTKILHIFAKSSNISLKIYLGPISTRAIFLKNFILRVEMIALVRFHSRIPVTCQSFCFLLIF